MNNDEPPPIPDLPDDDDPNFFIPDFAPAVKELPSDHWAHGTPQQKQEFTALKPIRVNEVTKDMVIAQLYFEAVNSRSNNQGARVKALATIALIKGWVKLSEKDEVPKVDTNNITPEESNIVATSFNAEY